MISFSTHTPSWQGQEGGQRGREWLSRPLSIIRTTSQAGPWLWACVAWLTQGCFQWSEDGLPKGQGEGLGQGERRKSQTWVEEVKKSRRNQLRPSQEKNIQGTRAYKPGRHTQRGEEASKASERSSWEGNGKLEGEGLSQEKTIQSRGTERVRKPETGKRKGLADSTRLRCGQRCPSQSAIRKGNEHPFRGQALAEPHPQGAK